MRKLLTTLRLALSLEIDTVAVKSLSTAFSALGHRFLHHSAIARQFILRKGAGRLPLPLATRFTLPA
ncbi:hypothetical protein D3M70_16115 [Pseudomonas sp. LS-2]|nr:hypothetical protein D3M70_16115 [Pseudomonas sp. LS-2]